MIKTTERRFARAAPVVFYCFLMPCALKRRQAKKEANKKPPIVPATGGR
jgi:iron only hydrogenase large subunit-like protein